MDPDELRSLAQLCEMKATLAPAFADHWRARARQLHAQADGIELGRMLILATWGVGAWN